jgi:hypothetical protein
VTCTDWPIRWPCDITDTDEDLLDLARESAQSILWGLSGRRYGVCETTESYRVACHQSCVPIYRDFGPGVEYLLGGRREVCCRLALAQIPVRAILSVEVDGVVIDPDTYALERDTLWRADSCWPCVDDCDEPAIVVTYAYGVDPPPLAELAMGELACEILAGVEGRDCRLPSNAVSVTRQGVTVDLGDAQTLFAQGRIGLPLSDAFLRMSNPGRLPSASRVYSPDMARRAR